MPSTPRRAVIKFMTRGGRPAAPGSPYEIANPLPPWWIRLSEIIATGQARRLHKWFASRNAANKQSE
jgi:hypothetical protein